MISVQVWLVDVFSLNDSLLDSCIVITISDVFTAYLVIYNLDCHEEICFQAFKSSMNQINFSSYIGLMVV